MAWIKVPVEHHPVFRAALPRDPRITVIRMFGGLAALYNGHIFAGLFARSIIARLPPEAHAEAMALDGASLFDPMGKGRPMRDTVLFPEEVMDDDGDLRRWLARALSHATSLPPKERKARKARTEKVAKPATQRPAQAKQAAGRARSAQQPAAAKKSVAVKPAEAKRSAVKSAAAAKPAAAKRPTAPRKPAATKRPVAAKAKRASSTKKPVVEKRAR